MHREKLMNDLFKGLLVAMVVALALPDLALAQPLGGQADLGATSGVVNGYVGAVAPLISTLFWVAGGVLMGAGALKLKEHAENPGQTPMRQGIARMAVGAALLSIPFFAQFVINSLAAGTAAVNYQAFTAP
jgi:hypothetical protein